MIGIITAPNLKQNLHCGKSYVYDVYIKWIEMAGENAILIPYTIDQKELKILLNRLNGIVWVGGAIENKKKHTKQQYDQLINTLFYTYQHVIRENDKGNYYPLWGTCLGFEILVMFAKNCETLDEALVDNSKHGLYPCIFTKESRMKEWFSSYRIQQMKQQKCVFHNHMYGTDTVPSDKVRVVARLDNYINAIEFIDYPIYGTLFHIEQPKTEFGIKIAEEYSHFFKHECSKNRNIWKWKLSDFKKDRLLL
jgi:gamma-glutamyl hydrolase